MKVFIHLGSWKTGTTLIQMQLRAAEKALEKLGSRFVDQNSEGHKSFRPLYAKAINALTSNGPTSATYKRARDASYRAFRKLTKDRNQYDAIYSWEPFLGHPLYAATDRLYHTSETVTWFEGLADEYDFKFRFYTRSQADFLESIYAQEVRKGRFISGIDDFLRQHVDGRSLSWLTVCDPLHECFGERFTAVPFEVIKEGTDVFLDSFFDWALSKPIEYTIDHANPSFSAKAVELALASYPLLDRKEILVMEKFLVKNFSNLTHPAARFLNSERRAEIVESVRDDNEILFKKYFPTFTQCLDHYLPKISVNGKGLSSQAPTKSLTAVSEFTIDLIDLNGMKFAFPVAVDDSSKPNVKLGIDGDWLAFDTGTQEIVLSSNKRFSFPGPTGKKIRLNTNFKTEGSAEVSILLSEFVENRLTQKLQMTPQAPRDHHLVRTTERSKISLSLLISGSGRLSLTDCSVSMSPPTELPSAVIIDSNGMRAVNAKNRPVELYAIDSERIRPRVPKSSSGVKNRSGSDRRTTLFLTVDVEDTHFERPVLMTGEGLKGSKTTREIMTELEKRHLKGTFYVNIYEDVCYRDHCVMALAKEIAERGHEVALHCHQTPRLKFYTRRIDTYDYDGQRRIIEYGKRRLFRATGQETVNFRAGGYRYNEITLRALESLGFRIDSSYYFRQAPPNIQPAFMTQPHFFGDLIELPVCYVPLLRRDATVVEQKLDINALRLRELSSVMEQAVSAGLPVLTFMMHSFSFIRKARYDANQPVDDVLLRSRGRRRYIGITGVDQDLFQSFRAFLDYICENPAVHVSTVSESLERLKQICIDTPSEEQVPIIFR